jgi:membrane associated rhomboid family serine protease
MPVSKTPPEVSDDASAPPRPVAWATWFIFASTVCVFLFQLHEQHLYGEDVVGNALAFSPGSLADGHWWTVLTYAWVHAVSMFGTSDFFWLHIVANMIPLICLGPMLEDLIGHWRFLGLYLGAAICSALIWGALNRGNGDDGIIGASGAVFGLIAGIGIAAPRARVTVYILYILPISMTLGILAVAICGAEIAQVIFGWLPEIAHSAHLGGAAFGFLYVSAWRLAARLTRTRQRETWDFSR